GGEYDKAPLWHAGVVQILRGTRAACCCVLSWYVSTSGRLLVGDIVIVLRFPYSPDFYRLPVDILLLMFFLYVLL
ncbi:hypothetical protein Q4595_20085, partial [Wenyingzhuangia sp. 1_MG-2023]|nr:hypothetical protein [Wenyingzhuangia sp. 1_MG-2023]